MWCALVISGCAPLPSVEAVHYAVDDAQLRERELRARVDAAAKLLADDPALHLQLEGHADEDNTDAYNEALSLRRAEAVRERMVARYPELAPRIGFVARGEWDPRQRPSADTAEAVAAAKAANRRVEFRFYYPRTCEPAWSIDFAECVLGRFDGEAEAGAGAEAEPESEAEPELESEAEPEAGPPANVGVYGFLGSGWSVSTYERVRQHVPLSLMLGYVWAPNAILRLSAGAELDHHFEIGPLFADEAGCRGACRQEVQPLRLLPEFRIGASQGRLWAHLKFFAGPVFLIRPELETRDPDGEGNFDTVVYPRRTTVGATFGLGPGFSVRLGRFMSLSFDFDVSVDARFGPGVGIYGGKVSLGAFARPRGAARSPRGR